MAGLQCATCESLLASPSSLWYFQPDMFVLMLLILFVGVASCMPMSTRHLPRCSPQDYGDGDGYGSHHHHHGGGMPIMETVDLSYSIYRGTTLQPAGVNQYLGIRFAEPPIGNLRWRAPADPAATTGVQQATQFQPVCLGLFNLNDKLSEDCLFLNIFTPANASTSSKLPVWFFIQGGGYAGDTDQNFNGTEVVMKSGFNMVFVQINYRVGAYGFLASERIREDGDLNVGLLDQRKAMYWFGGDPEHVVIHGDSAGGGSVAHHLTAYGGRDDHLFVGAIAESPFWPTQRTVLEMEFQFEIFARNLSCLLTDEVMSCLRSKDTATLQNADVVSPFPGGPSTLNPSWYFLPVIDGEFSTDYLYSLFEQGRTVRVPLMVGDDTDEGTGFSPNAETPSQFLDFIDSNYPNLSEKTLQQISRAYPEDGFTAFPNHGPYFPATAQAYGEATLTCPGIQMSYSLARYHSAEKTWNYRYNVQDRGSVADGYGVPHVSEKPAIWGPNNAGFCGIPCSYETYNAAIVPVVMSYWISFIRALDPNRYRDSSAPYWQSWQSGRDGWGEPSRNAQRLKIETNASAMEVLPSAQLERCELWRRLATITEQ